MVLKKLSAVMATLMTGVIGWSSAVLADDRIAKAVDKQMGFQEPATEIMRRITELHDWLLIMCVVVTLFVFALLGWCIIRYNHKRNPTPAKFSHNTLIEIIWTAVPIFILVAIAIPSFRLLYYQDVIPEADMSINITGHQWYWSYEYPDYDGISFDANMMPAAWFENNLDQATQDDKTAAIQDIQRMLDMPEMPEVYRLLEADTRVVVPVNKTVKIVVTADDVIHAWSIPAFGVKVDTVPGRTNEKWFHAEETGTYYGQCSELCGIYHAFMPIVVEVVTEEEFEAWLGRAKAVYASNDNGKFSRMAKAN